MTSQHTLDEAELSNSRLELLRHALSACLKNGLSSSLAEDLVQDAIVELFEFCEAGDRLPCSQIAFLKRTIWNRAIDRIRQTKKHSALLRENREHVMKPQHPKDEDHIACAEIANEIFERLAKEVEAKGDDEAWYFLQALRDDPAGTRSALVAASGLPLDRYEAAKKRVAALLNHVPAELQGVARDIVGAKKQEKAL